MAMKVTFSESTNTKLILLVDDDALVRESLYVALSQRGYRVVERDSGAAALDYLRHGERPDLILLDLVMPKMDGWEFRVAQLSDDALASIPVVALSGDSSAKARALNADAILAKPITSPLLYQTLDCILRRTSDLEEAQLAGVAAVLETAIAPLRLATDIGAVNVEAALTHLLEQEADASRLLGWLRAARGALRGIEASLLRGEMLARHGRGRVTRARVLIVDCDEQNRELLSVALGELYAAEVAANAADALAMLTASDDFDLVVSQIWMPGATGADLLLQLSRTHPEQAARIVFFSGSSERELREELRIAQERHLGVHLGPPCLDAIRKLVERRRDEPAH
jgi:CheY-like chemotaxis protein